MCLYLLCFKGSHGTTCRPSTVWFKITAGVTFPPASLGLLLLWCNWEPIRFILSSHDQRWFTSCPSADLQLFCSAGKAAAVHVITSHTKRQQVLKSYLSLFSKLWHLTLVSWRLISKIAAYVMHSLNPKLNIDDLSHNLLANNTVLLWYVIHSAPQIAHLNREFL